MDKCPLGIANDIADVDRAIDELHERLRALETIDPMSADSWQAAWNKHPHLRETERELFRRRGELQDRRDSVVLVNCTSARARFRLRSSCDVSVAHWHPERKASKGAYFIPVASVARARAIPGVTVVRSADGWLACF